MSHCCHTAALTGLMTAQQTQSTEADLWDIEPRPARAQSTSADAGFVGSGCAESVGTQVCDGSWKSV